MQVREIISGAPGSQPDHLPVGMVLTLIQGEDIRKLPEHEAKKKLAGAGRPLLLTFCKPDEKQEHNFYFGLQLRLEGWKIPGQGESEAERLVGRRVFVHSLGAATVKKYVKPMFGSNYHEVQFDNERGVRR